MDSAPIVASVTEHRGAGYYFRLEAVHDIEAFVDPASVRIGAEFPFRDLDQITAIGSLVAGKCQQQRLPYRGVRYHSRTTAPERSRSNARCLRIRRNSPVRHVMRCRPLPRPVRWHIVRADFVGQGLVQSAVNGLTALRARPLVDKETLRHAV